MTALGNKGQRKYGTSVPIILNPDFDTKLVFVQKNINNINESVLGYSKV